MLVFVDNFYMRIIVFLWFDHMLLWNTHNAIQAVDLNPLIYEDLIFFGAEYREIWRKMILKRWLIWNDLNSHVWWSVESFRSIFNWLQKNNSSLKTLHFAGLFPQFYCLSTSTVKNPKLNCKNYHFAL